MRQRPAVAGLLLLVLLVPLVASGQGRRSLRQADVAVDYDSHFAFTRIRYGAGREGLARGFFGGSNAWAHDYPVADRNLAAILDYITNMRVRLDGSNILDLDDPRIFENPILYMSEPGYWVTNDGEAESLRAYLLKGGFIIFDDFEGDGHWRNLVAQMNRALPGHHFIHLDVSHPIFQTFFGIRHLNIPHPTVNVPPDYFAIFENNDPSGRMLALANWNNDLGDYWEWSAEGLYGDDPTNDAYRLGVNYIVYAMTH
ncbi:MAG: DUF4159 domain-containing protein [Acidobacteria bacterium]|nr:DUF4159 domain-containing protein [Acidobacteriota bacterium]